MATQPPRPGGERVGLILGIGGAVLSAIGIGLYLYSRSRRPATLGYVQNRVEAGGMKLELHYHPTMPIERRVALVKKKTFESVNDPRMRKISLGMTRHCPARDGVCESTAIGDYYNKHVRYTGDVAPLEFPNGEVEGIDLFQSAFRTLEFEGGDCDDHSIGVATSLLLNGIPARFRITKPAPSADWGHIYVLAGLPKENPTQWIPVDTTLPNYRFGLEYPYAEKIDFVA